MRYGILVMAMVVAGCATPRVMFPTKYAIDPKVEVGVAQCLDKSLGIRPVQAARPYRQKVVYRDAGFVLGEYPSVEWAEMPADVFTRVLADAIVATRRFRDVGNAADLVMPDLILTGELRKFDVVRSASPWAAECEVRLELRDAQEPQAVWAQTLSERVPLERDDPAALPAAMTTAVEKVVKRAAEEIAGR